MGRVKSSAYKSKPKKPSRIAYVKLRVIPLVPMPKSVLLEKVRESCENQSIDPEIDVRYVEYDHQYNGVRKGFQTISRAKKLEALANFYKLVTNADAVEVE